MRNRLLGLRGRGMGGQVPWLDVTVPAAFAAAWTLPFTIQQAGRSFRIKSGWSISSYAPAGKKYYVDRAMPDDTGDGLTPATALQKVSSALGKADVVEIHIAAGIYSSGYGWDNASPARNISIYGTGNVILSPHLAGLSWTAVDAHYTATIATCNYVLDASIVDANGDYQILTKKTSEAQVDATANSWYFTGTTVYVHTSDSRAPDANIWPYITGGNGNMNDPNTYYLENLKFYGGLGAFAASESTLTPKLYAKNCEFKYSYSSNGLTVTGFNEVVLQDCFASNNKVDGFHPNELTIYTNMALINCKSWSNGYLVGAAENCNGYSRHDRGNTVIVGGEMWNNYGRQIQDVNDGLGGGKTWILGCHNHDSCAPTAGNDINFSMAGADCIMWLDSCHSSGSQYDVEAGTSAVVNLRSLVGDATNTGAGTLQAY